MGNPNRRPPKANAIPLGGIAPKVTANNNGWAGADAVGWGAETTSGGADDWGDPAPAAPANTGWDDSAKTTEWDAAATEATDGWGSSIKDAQIDGGRDSPINGATADNGWGAAAQKSSGGWDELGTPQQNNQHSSVEARKVTQHSSDETTDSSSAWTNAENQIPETVTYDSTADNGWGSKQPGVTQCEVSNSRW